MPVSTKLAAWALRPVSRPRIEYQAARAKAMLGLVAVGLGVTIAPETLAKLPAPSVVIRPLRQRLICEHVVIWRATAVTPLTAAFLGGLAGARSR